MMETSRHPVEVVARRTGFSDRRRRQAFLCCSPQAMQAALFSTGAGAFQLMVQCNAARVTRKLSKVWLIVRKLDGLPDAAGYQHRAPELAHFI